MSPFFSVIIPTYNRANSVAEAVESVLAQSFRDFELIVVDDGSTDNTKELLKPVAAADNRLRYIFQENAERSAARNNGICQAKGRFICFLDSDDLYLKHHLKQFHKTVSSNNYKTAFYLGNSVSERNGKLIEEPPYVTETKDPLELVLKISICSQRVCIEKSILQKHKYNVNLRVGEDQELWTRIVKEYPLIHSNQHSVIIRDLGDRTIDYANSDTYKANISLKKKLIAADTEHRIRPEWSKFILSAAYYKLAISFLLNNSYTKFLITISKSILTDRSHFLKDKILLILSTIPILSIIFKKRAPKFGQE